ncbi:hypothetical protein [Prosthecobacter sp.]|uniref:hypothetical protein n=1 Tax=Prosthecobacter sp. TaxID=1965333 RepID=UPI002486DEA5|nr:hypothetical protein [Prosthecobacter sp.]MDI1315135.1 hypothetical protein [Prosthecobacter sp.]
MPSLFPIHGLDTKVLLVPPGFRGNKDKRLAMLLPDPYAMACEKAKKEGKMKEHLKQVSAELSPTAEPLE